MTAQDANALQGDCREVMKRLDSDSIDAIVTDPPYLIGFMNKSWDSSGITCDPAVWSEAFRVLKPGGHILVFGGTRTHHRVWCAIEDAGFQIRDTLAWIYGSGFPKSHNVGLSVDKIMGEPDRGHRIAVANRHHPDGTLEPNGELLPAYEPKTEEGKQWQGFGTGLKPAMETICLARKPLSERNVALNVLKWNCGALNIDGCRIETSESLNGGGYSAGEPTGSFGLHHQSPEAFKQPSGRFPANLIHDGSQEVLELFNKAKIHCAGYAKEGSKSFKGDTSIFGIGHSSDGVNRFGDSGSAARFFYCAKASRSERDAGLDGVEAVQRDTGRKEGNPGGDNPRNRGLQLRHNDHATIKPLKLMRYLVTLITPPGGIVCDPFAGSGSTLIAAKQLGFGYVGIELDPHNVEIIQKRLAATELFS